jgi:hypothetical protein
MSTAQHNSILQAGRPRTLPAESSDIKWRECNPPTHFAHRIYLYFRSDLWNRCCGSTRAQPKTITSTLGIRSTVLKIYMSATAAVLSMLALALVVMPAVPPMTAFISVLDLLDPHQVAFNPFPPRPYLAGFHLCQDLWFSCSSVAHSGSQQVMTRIHPVVS